MIPFLIFMIRRFINRRRKLPGLFYEALRNENSGQFETAVLSYERVLEEANKKGTRASDLKTMITEKLKILHSVIAYKNGFIPAGK